MKTTKLIIAAGALCLAACSSEDGGKSEFINDIPVTDNIELTTGERAVNDRMNDFAFKLFNEAATATFNQGSDRNVCVSPLSASLALSMLANTGNDATTAEIAGMLGFDDLATLNSAVNKLMRYLPSKKSGATLELANAAWFRSTLTVKPEYTDNIARTFYAETNGADFSDPATIGIVNSWCNEKSHGLIPTIIDNISEQTAFILVNALYFNGKWAEPFDKSLTQQRVFLGSKGEGTVEMMHSEDVGDYVANDYAEGIRLPFNGTTQMVALLPKDGHTASELARTMSATDYRNLTVGSEFRPLLDLPRFSIDDYYSEFIEVLKALGLTDVTYPEKMGHDLETQLSAVQKNRISIDEEGAELASSTVIDGLDTNSPQRGIDKRLTFNRPFLFFVENTTTGTILMAGVVNAL